MAPRTRNSAPAPEPEPSPDNAVATTDQAQDTAVQVVNPQVAAFRRVEQALTARSDSLLAVLPGKVGVDRFMRVALGAMSRQPRLFDCTTESLVKSMLDAAELGLEPSGLMGQAYLVPFRNKVKRPHPTNPNVTVEVFQDEATLMIGYRGLAELARRSGQVANAEARAVRQRDVFSVTYGTQAQVHHIPYMPGLMGAPAPTDPDAPADGAGPYRAFYAVLTMKDGAQVVDVMTVAEVDAIRKRSRSGDSGPWVTDYAEMGRKTVLRRALKYAPVSIVDLRVAEALDAEDRAQFGQAGPMQASVQVATTQAPAITAAAQSFRQAASGQPVDPAWQDDQGAMAAKAPQAAQEAPGQPEAPHAEPVADQPPQADPGPSQAPEPEAVVQAPKARQPKRCGSRASNDARCSLEAGHALPHQGDGQSWVNPEEQASAPVQGEVVGGQQMVACEQPSPYGDNVTCLMPKGHRGAHRSHEGTW